MERYEYYWQRAKDTLKKITVNLISSFKGSELRQQNDHNIKRMRVERENLRYSDPRDRQYILDDLSRFRRRQQEFDIQFYQIEKFISSPYFNKITTIAGETYFVSKHMADFSQDIVLYTAPIAKLRFSEIGEKVNINGTTHILSEKEELTIIDSKLIGLEHENISVSFNYDGKIVKYVSRKPNGSTDIEVKKEKLKKQKNLNKIVKKTSPALSRATDKIREEQDTTMRAPHKSITIKKEKLKKQKDSNKIVKTTSRTLGSIADKMRKEQDDIMRAPYEGITLIKGSAGSGKTNIAFHRIVYLINEYPAKFRQKNIAVFCFNLSLKKYLSELANKLDIQNIQVNSFDRWIYHKMQRLAEISRINYNEGTEHKKLKSRKEVIDLIQIFLHTKQRDILTKLRKDSDLLHFEYFYKEIESTSRLFTLKDFIALREYSQDAINNNNKINNKIEMIDLIDKKLEEIMNTHYFFDFKWERTNQELKLNIPNLMESFNSSEPYSTYLRNNGVSNELNFSYPIKNSDFYIVVCISLLIFETFESKYFAMYDHIIVDEVQDFTPVQMWIINKLHKNSMTIAGDIAQKIFDNGVETWNDFDLKMDNIYELNLSHRSTLETILFANQLMGKNKENSKSSFVAKRGKKPCVVFCDDFDDEIAKTISIIKKIKQEEQGSSFVVVYPKNNRDELMKINNEFNKKGLKSYIAIRNNWEFANKIAITTYHQIKGLQFDFVFILGSNEFDNFSFSNKYNVFYTVVTRAQKRVFITIVRELPEIIKSVDKDLYELKENFIRGDA